MVNVLPAHTNRSRELEDNSGPRREPRADLTDNGLEYCDRLLHHRYELFLTVEQMEHRNTKAHTPKTDGFCERFTRTLKEEFFGVAYRKTL